MFDSVETFCRPASVSEALRLLQQNKGRARILAGGTDLAVAGGDSVRVLIDITQAGLSYIRRRGAALAIGATTTLAELEASADLHTFASGILPRAAALCGSPSIRNLATLGGNLANASPAADMATALLALDAVIVLADARGRRKQPLPEYLRTAAKGDAAKSILVEVLIPAPPTGKHCRWAFQKLGRTAVDISLVNVAVGLQLDRKHVSWARIALGAVAPSAMRAEGAERLLLGRVLNESLIAEAAAEVSREVQPVSDARASSDYRREMSAVLVKRALRESGGLPGGSL